jgi:hypothetical protein
MEDIRRRRSGRYSSINKNLVYICKLYVKQVELYMTKKCELQSGKIKEPRPLLLICARVMTEIAELDGYCDLLRGLLMKREEPHPSFLRNVSTVQ